MTATPLISLGLPVYNGERYLSQAIDSTLAQTYTNFELIISDNGSTDQTEAICQAYAAQDARIKYYRQSQNLGAAKNFNFTFEQASGKYFKWIAADDMCAPSFLAVCLNALETQTDAVVSYTHTSFIDENSEHQGYYKDELDLQEASSSARFKHFLSKPGWCHPVFGLIRRDVLQKTRLIGNYPRSDRNLIGELALYGKLIELPEPLFYRRLHDEISTVVNESESELATWFDPANAGKRTFPRWRRLYEYIRAIGLSPNPVVGKFACYALLFQFVFVPQKWLGLFQDFVAKS